MLNNINDNDDEKKRREVWIALLGALFVCQKCSDAMCSVYKALKEYELDLE